MKKNLKNVLAVVAAGTMLLSAIPAFGAQDASSLADGTAYLNINNADWSDFDAEWTNAEITGDGTYTVAMEASEGQKLAQFNALEVANGEATIGSGAVLTVDEIKINGEAVELQGDCYTCSADGDGVVTRVNIYNEWNSPVDEDGNVAEDVRVADGVDAASATACLFSNDYVDSSSASGYEVTSMEVTFTVSGYGTTKEASGDAAATNATDLDGTYGAYLCMQGPKYTFRDAWDNADTGFGTDFFNQVTKQGDTVNGESVPADIHDAEIAGNGTYTVSINNIEFPDDEFEAQDYMNLIVLSTSIPNDGAITISDVVLKVNGSEVSDITPTQEEDCDYVKLNIQNIWSEIETVKSIGFYNTPVTDIEISFTVSGFNYDAEVAEAVDATEDTEVAEPESNSISPVPFIIVGAVVIIAAVVVVVVVVNKKKKAN